MEIRPAGAHNERRIGAHRGSRFRRTAAHPPLTVSADPRDQDRWDNKYQEDRYLFGKEAIPFLAAHVNLLPKGRALDLAMGEGRNGVFLATCGFHVTGLDISARGLEKAQRLAKERGVTIETSVVDLETMELEPESYDTILSNAASSPRSSARLSMEG